METDAQELKQKKTKLEYDVTNLLLDFINETGLSISEIDLIQAEAFGSMRPETKVVGVKIKIYL